MKQKTESTKKIIKRCEGNGQGSCTRCTQNGKWNRSWMCFLYKIEGMDGFYCSDCVKAIVNQNSIKIGN